MNNKLKNSLLVKIKKRVGLVCFAAFLSFLSLPVFAENNCFSAGKTLHSNDQIISNNKMFTLKLQQDGNVVLRGANIDGKDNAPLFATNTATSGSGGDNYYLAFQGDGNLVLYSGGSSNKVVWASNTEGHENASLCINDDGNLVIYDENNAELWATETKAYPQTIIYENIEDTPLEVSPDAYPLSNTGTALVPENSQSNSISVGNNKICTYSTDSIGQIYNLSNYANNNNLVCKVINDGIEVVYVGNIIKAGSLRMEPDQPMISENGQFRLTLQKSDGNVVLRGENIGEQDNVALFATNTATSGSGIDDYYLVFQGDGNLVLYSGGSNNKVLWASNTDGNASATLHLQNDGNLIIRSENGTVLWKTNTDVADHDTILNVTGRQLMMQNSTELVKIYNNEAQPTISGNKYIVYYDDSSDDSSSTSSATVCSFNVDSRGKIYNLQSSGNPSHLKCQLTSVYPTSGKPTSSYPVSNYLMILPQTYYSACAAGEHTGGKPKYDFAYAVSCVFGYPSQSRAQVAAIRACTEIFSGSIEYFYCKAENINTTKENATSNTSGVTNVVASVGIVTKPGNEHATGSVLQSKRYFSNAGEDRAAFYYYQNYDNLFGVNYYKQRPQIFLGVDVNTGYFSIKQTLGDFLSPCAQQVVKMGMQTGLIDNGAVTSYYLQCAD